MNHPLHPIREYYLNCFRESVVKARSELDQFTTELLMEIPTLKYKEYCYRLYRVDIIGKKNGESKILEVNVTERQAMKPESFSASHVCFDAPIVWNGVEFEVQDSSPDEPALIEWTSRWMDIFDSKYKKAAEFQEAVHSVTPPTITASGFSISVDFGSAPTSAFDELTEILSRDSRKVSIGSFFLFRENA